MKIIFYIFITFSYLNNLFICFGQDTVKGGYGQCLVYSYDFFNGEIDSNSKFLSHSIKYNSKGKKIEKISYNSDGSFSLIYSTEFDGDSNMIENEKYFNEGRIIQIYKNKYNRIGYKTETEWISIKDKKKSQRVINYDTRGNKIEEIVYDTDGNIQWKETNKYNLSNKMMERISCNIVSKMYWRDIFEYDKDVNQVKEVRYRSDESMNWKQIWGVYFSYDSLSKIIEKLEYDHKGNLEKKFTYKYDIKGQKIEDVEFKSDGYSIKLITNYQYDGKGNVIEESEYLSDSTLHQKQIHKYDSRGNEIFFLRQFYIGTYEDIIKQVKYIYDSNSNMTEIISYDADHFYEGDEAIGIKFEHTKYKYDVFGNQIEEVNYNHLDEPAFLFKFIYAK